MKFNSNTKIVLILLFFILIGFWFRANAHQPGIIRPQFTQIQIPRNFNPLQWNNDGWISGLVGDKFVRYNPDTGATRVIFPHVWDGVMDINGVVLAFHNDRGLFYMDLQDSQGPILITNGSDITVHIWSHDGRQLLYSYVNEYQNDYYIYDRKTGESRPFEFKNIENYMSIPLLWTEVDGEELILFRLRFSSSKTGEREFRRAGYRAEFYRANLQGEFTPLVEVNDGQYVIFQGLAPDGRTGYYNLFTQADVIHQFDLLNGKLEVDWQFENGRRVWIAPENGLAFVRRNLLELIDIKSGETLQQFIFAYKRAIWSPDHKKALVLPSENSAITTGFLLQLP